ncbi:hypothetical protein [Natronorubrum halophilum]|uniref:hypothetical protein n=1 Tax=Natronorubrum halophilum TaxID=1702106 RepID=UPI0013CEB5E9|nr:hypothetical protein [Natronorubrum halophilum]
MSVGDTLTAVGRSEISLLNAVSIVIATAPFGSLFGFFFTTHFVSEETTAVWLTTIAFAVLGLIVWSVRFE